MKDLTAQRSMRTADVVLFCILAGVLATFSRGYVAGGPFQEDQLGFLPMLLRTLDPGYLSHDVRLNAATSGMGPRSYFMHLLATLAIFIPVPWLMLLMTMVGHALLAWATFQVARAMHARSDLAAVLAVAMVLNVNSFDLGRADMLGSQELKPSSLMMGIALLSLWMGLNGRLIWCTVLGAVVIPIHPLVGVEVPAIGLATRAVEALLPGAAGDDVPRSRWRTLGGVAASLAALVLVTYGCFHTKPPDTLPTARFIEIVAACRHPHLYLPSTFSRHDYACAAAFLLAMWLSWQVWKQDDAAAGTLPRRVLIANGVVLLMLLCGYVFVEVIPTRAWVTAQTFRMVTVTKWFGFLLFAVVAAQWLTRRRSFVGAAPGWCLLMGIGPLQPLAVLLGHTLYSARGWLATRTGRAVLPLLTGLALVSIVSFGTDGLWVEAQGLVLVAGMGLWYLFAPPRWPTRLAPAVAVLVLSFLLLSDYTPTFEIPGVFVRPMVRCEDPRNPCCQIGLFARQHTPEDSLFILPPDLGNFQIVAQRAVVVQWKFFNHDDVDMELWYQQIHDCYCDPSWKDPPVKDALVDRYYSISKEQLLRVAKKYGATHAVLHRLTPCDLPVLYADHDYKIVRLDGG